MYMDDIKVLNQWKDHSSINGLLSNILYSSLEKNEHNISFCSTGKELLISHQ